MDNSTERIERLLSLILLELMKGKKQEDKVVALNMAGLSNLEIAELLNIKSVQVISNYLYKSKKPKNK